MAQLLIPQNLSFQSVCRRRPKQIPGPLVFIPHILGNQHPGHMVGKLLPGMVVFVRSISQSIPGIIFQAVRHRLQMIFPIISADIRSAMLFNIRVPLLPDFRNQIQKIYMWFYIGAVHQPIFRCFAFPGFFQFPPDQFRGIGHHGNMICCLQIIEGHMVVNAVLPRLPCQRQGGNPGIMIFLSPGYHFSKSIVRPYLNHVLRNIQPAALVQFHGFPVQIRTADGVWLLCLHHIILLPQQTADQLSLGLRSLVLRVIDPEGIVPLSPKAKGPDHIPAFLPLNPLFPKLLEFLRMLPVRRREAGIRLHKHLRPQRLGVVMGQIQPHVRGQRAVLIRIPPGSGNHQVPAATKQRFQRHFPGFFFFLFHLPCVQKNLIVQKPTPIFYCIRL